MKLIWRIAKVLLITVYAVCAVALVVFLVPATGYQAKSIATGSMRPKIPPGSLVIIHKVSYQQLAVGDVVTYTKSVQPPVTITHRIIKKTTEKGTPYLITKGDANAAPDPAIPGGAVVGKVIVNVPYIGNATAAARNPAGVILLVVIPGMLIIIDEIGRLRRALAKSEPKKSEPKKSEPPAPNEPPEPPSPPAGPEPPSQHHSKPATRRGLDGMTIRRSALVLAFGLSLAVGTTQASLQTNAVKIKGIKLTTAPAPGIHPQTIYDCLNNGWKKYGFKNLGFCVVYVVQHNRNPAPPPTPPIHTPHPTLHPLPTHTPLPTPIFHHVTPTPTPAPSASPSPSPSPTPMHH